MPPSDDSLWPTELEISDPLRQGLQDFAVIRLDFNGKILQWNTGAEIMFGYTAPEATGQSFEILFTPEDRAANAPAQELRGAALNEKSEDQRWHLRQDGHRIWVSGIVRALRNPDGELIGFSKIAREVTSHKLEELRREEALDRLKDEMEKRKRTEALAEERARVVGEQAALLDLAQDAILAISQEQIVEFWNHGAEQMYGWSKEEAVGKDAYALLHTEARIPLEEIEQIVYAEGEWQGELRQAHRSGREIEVSSRWVVWKKSGAPAGWLEINRDITKQKRMEAHLRQTDKLESLGVLAGGIAHDFNNLLTGILGNISLASERAERGLPISDILANASEASERAAMLTKQMLAYAGKGQFVVQPVNLSAVVRETMRLLAGSIPANVLVELALAHDLPPVDADTTQLQQVAMNLIMNAVEAIGPSGGQVIVKTGNQDVDSAAAATRYDIGRPTPGRYVVFEVHDSGAGIDPSIRENIFDPFFTTKFTGRGLGLAAVSGIVRSLNGAALVDSTPEQGTTFRILFPAGMASLATAVAGVQRKRPILVVDDEEVVRKAAEGMLRSRGYEVVVAATGREAVDTFRRLEGRFALVLLDMTMPGMNGEEVFQLIKEIRSDVPVFISSGHSEQEANRRFGGLGVAGFIQKPYTVKALTEKIAGVLK
jgi:two-component system, cell cycle sensor histidine kinase and response regulator CckA